MIYFQRCIGMLLAFYCLLQNGYGQSVPSSKIPIDTALITGKLSNGFTYYIRSHKAEQNTAELYLVVKAGSLQEEDSQQGLAHFLEHMAFNGTADFPKNEIVDYMQRAGMRLGADLNAFTGFNQTVYRLPLPSDKPEVFKKGFEMIANWASKISLEHKAVDEERGVILEEARQGGMNAEERMNRKILPVLLGDSRYAQRLPIGKTELIKNFDYTALESFYRDWYRPDMQAIIAIGDFDPDLVKTIIKDVFSSIPARKEPKRLQEYFIPFSKDPLAVVVTDPEFPQVMATLTYGHKPLLRFSKDDIKKEVLASLINNMLANRFQKLTSQPDAPALYANGNYAPFQGGSVNMDAFSSVVVVASSSQLTAAVQWMITQLNNIRVNGFEDTEIESARLRLLSGIKNQYMERDKLPARFFANSYIDHFIKDQPPASPGFIYDLYSAIIPALSKREIDEFAAGLLSTPVAVTIQAPSKDSSLLPTETDLIRWVSSSEKSLPAATVTTSGKASLLNKIPEAGKLLSSRLFEEAGVTRLLFSNGATVFLKPTDFRNNEIVFSASGKGGLSKAADKGFIASAHGFQLIANGGVGSFDRNALMEVLGGAGLSVNPYINDFYEGINGFSVPADIEKALQLIYLYFTQPAKDDKNFNSSLQRLKAFVQGRSVDPQAVFRDTVEAVFSNYNPRSMPLKEPDIDLINIDTAYRFFKERFDGVAGFNFAFAGNFKVEEMIPLMETYIASLPAGNKDETISNVLSSPPKGPIRKTIRKGLGDKATVTIIYHGAYLYNKENNQLLDLLREVVLARMNERLREKEAAIYTPSVNMVYKQYPTGSYYLEIGFTCAPDKAYELLEFVREEITLVVEKGVREEELQKFITQRKRQLDLQLNTNFFWVNYILNHTRQGELTRLTEALADPANLTLESVNRQKDGFLNQQNVMEFILLPEVYE